MKRRIRITESKLKKIISESVKRVLRESDEMYGGYDPRIIDALNQPGMITMPIDRGYGVKRETVECHIDFDEGSPVVSIDGVETDGFEGQAILDALIDFYKQSGNAVNAWRTFCHRDQFENGRW